MAGDDGEGEFRDEGSHEPRECMPCRGSGQVISNLGGTPGKLACPWCGGSGTRLPGIDAQAHWPAPESTAARAADTDPAPAPAPSVAADPAPAAGS